MAQSSDQEQSSSEEQDQNERHDPGPSFRARLPPLFEDHEPEPRLPPLFEDEDEGNDDETHEQLDGTSDLPSQLQQSLDLRPSTPTTRRPRGRTLHTRPHALDDMRSTDSIHSPQLLRIQLQNAVYHRSVVPQKRLFVSDEEKELAHYEGICEAGWIVRISRIAKAKSAAERRRILDSEFDVVRAAAQKLQFEAGMKFYRERGFLLIKERQLWAVKERWGWI